MKRSQLEPGGMCQFACVHSCETSCLSMRVRGHMFDVGEFNQVGMFDVSRQNILLPGSRAGVTFSSLRGCLRLGLRADVRPGDSC